MSAPRSFLVGSKRWASEVELTGVLSNRQNPGFNCTFPDLPKRIPSCACLIGGVTLRRANQISLEREEILGQTVPRNRSNASKPLLNRSF